MTFYDAAELKKRFLETTNFGDFHDYYLTNFVERGNFTRLGRTLSAPRAQSLNLALAEAYAKVASVSPVAISSLFIEVPELGIVHGALHVNGKLASVLYFDDISMGMFAVVENGSTGEMKYMRFTTKRHSPGKPN